MSKGTDLKKHSQIRIQLYQFILNPYSDRKTPTMNRKVKFDISTPFLPARKVRRTSSLQSDSDPILASFSKKLLNSSKRRASLPRVDGSLKANDCYSLELSQIIWDFLNLHAVGILNFKRCKVWCKWYVRLLAIIYDFGPEVYVCNFWKLKRTFPTALE